MDSINYLEAILLGIIQGLTEFLPISSSGHLVLFQEIMNVDSPEVILEVVLHMGTLLAILIYYRIDIFNLIKHAFKGERDAIQYIINVSIATIPITLFGIFIKCYRILGLFLAISYFMVAILIKQD